MQCSLFMLMDSLLLLILKIHLKAGSETNTRHVQNMIRCSVKWVNHENLPHWHICTKPVMKYHLCLRVPTAFLESFPSMQLLSAALCLFRSFRHSGSASWNIWEQSEIYIAFYCRACGQQQGGVMVHSSLRNLYSDAPEGLKLEWFCLVVFFLIIPCWNT